MEPWKKSEKEKIADIIVEHRLYEDTDICFRFRHLDQATDKEYCNDLGIHVIQPTEDDLLTAVAEATRDSFYCIYIYL